MQRKYARFVVFVVCLLSVSILPFCSGNPEKTLEKIAADTSMSLPQIIDEYTTLTSCESMPGRTLKLTYLVKNVSYNPTQQRDMEKAMKEVLMKKLKERKEIEFYLVNNVRFEHVFLDAVNREIMNINIEALDYK